MLLLVEPEATTILGSRIEELLLAEGIDYERFGARWYSEEHDGYLEMRTTDSIPLSHHGRNTIELQLEERREWTEKVVSRLVSRKSDDRPPTGHPNPKPINPKRITHTPSLTLNRSH